MSASFTSTDPQSEAPVACLLVEKKLNLKKLDSLVFLADVGLRWSELVKTLNPSYDWENAILAAMETEETLAQVYLIHFELVSFNRDQCGSNKRALHFLKQYTKTFLS